MIRGGGSTIWSGLVLAAGLSACAPERPAIDLRQVPLIPQPRQVEATNSSFLLQRRSKIQLAASTTELQELGNYLGDLLRPATGFALPVVVSAGAPRRHALFLQIDAQRRDLPEEGYELAITTHHVALLGRSAAGLMRGIQTLRQLLPPAIEAATPSTGPWAIGTGTIRDYPEYPYRGAMLDIARHFFDVPTIKRYIDYLVAYKMNVLHLHLSDDQGWRIEIKSWPRLATYGGSTQVGGGKGGFLTQRDYQEIVAYAQQRHLTIVPEIDMPGHTNAALAAYPELNCTPRTPTLYTGTQVGFSTLCTTSPQVYTFIDDVVREIAALTPGPYFHIGGDESQATPPAEYRQFVEQVQALVRRHGKIPLGWEDIAQAKLEAGVVAQHWTNPANALKAQAQGAKIVLSPAPRAYLDMQYDSTSRLGLHWAGYLEVDTAYNWNPATQVPGLTRENILGVEAPLWSETISTLADIEYLLFPRLPGYAELGWSAPAQLNWSSYRQRLGQHAPRFLAQKIQFYPSPRVEWSTAASTPPTQPR